MSIEPEELYKLYKLIKSKIKKKCEDHIEIYLNNEMDTLLEIGKNQDNIAKININFPEIESQDTAGKINIFKMFKLFRIL